MNRNHDEKSGKPKGLIVKFWGVNISDFKIETIAYMVFSPSGLCPKILDVADNGSYRVVELADARIITQQDHSHPMIAKSGMEKLADLHNNPTMIKYVKERHPEGTTFLSSVHNEQTGMFHFATKRRIESEWSVCPDPHVAKIQAFLDKIFKDPTEYKA
jgi:hypothetical protein